MNLFHSSSTRIAGCVALFASLAAISSAQRTFSFPHVLENNGTIEAIWWDVTGGQDSTAEGSLRKNRYLSMLAGGGARMHGNDVMFQWLKENLAGKTTPWSFTICRVGPRQSTALDGTYSKRVTNMTPDKVVFPGGNADQKESRDVLVSGSPEKVETDPTYAPNANAAMVARKQKAWLCSNFRLRLGDLPCSRVTRFDPLVFDLRLNGDLDGDGTADLVFDGGDIGFEIPDEDSAPFLEEFRKSQEGSPSSLPFAVDYLDDDGNLLMSVQMTVRIRSVGPSDIFINPLTSNQKTYPKVVTIKHELKGHVTLIR